MAEPNQQQIQIRDNFAGGEYANNMRMLFSKEEMTLLFDNIVPPSGRVVGKIIVSPGHLKRIVKVLQDSLGNYEKQFGKVEEAAMPKNEIGFQERAV